VGIAAEFDEADPRGLVFLQSARRAPPWSSAGVQFIDDNGVGPGVASRKLVACREIVLHLTLWQIWL